VDLLKPRVVRRNLRGRIVFLLVIPQLHYIVPQKRCFKENVPEMMVRCNQDAPMRVSSELRFLPVGIEQMMCRPGEPFNISDV
jgi:hypothetical protein